MFLTSDGFQLACLPLIIGSAKRKKRLFAGKKIIKIYYFMAKIIDFVIY